MLYKMIPLYVLYDHEKQFFGNYSHVHRPELADSDFRYDMFHICQCDCAYPPAFHNIFNRFKGYE